MDLESVLSPPPSRLSAAPLATPLASDERLAKLAGRGDETAFGMLYKRYHRPLYRYCCSLLRNEADAEDAVQCAFVSALRSLRREQREMPVRPWLFRIAHNESVSLVRRRRPEQELPDGCEARTVSLEEQVEERERLAMLVADLGALSERQRAALVMREMSGLSHKEIALALSVSVDAAKQSIFEARRSLQEFTEGRSMDCDEMRRMISDVDGHRMLRSRRVRAHARHCPDCAAFAAAIPERSRRLKALVPGLPPAAAAGLVRWIAGSMGAGDAAGVAASVGQTVGTGIGLALKAAALTAAAAVVAAGAGIELPHVFEHQARRGGASPAVRLAPGVSGRPPSRVRSPGTSGVRAAAEVGAVGYGDGALRARVHPANGMISIGVWPADGQAGNATAGQTSRNGGQQAGAGQSGGKDGATSTGQTGTSSSSTSDSQGEDSGGNEDDGQSGRDRGAGQSSTAGAGGRPGSSGSTGEGESSRGGTGGGQGSSGPSARSNPQAGGNDAANGSNSQGAPPPTVASAGRVAAQDDPQSMIDNQQ